MDQGSVILEDDSEVERQADEAEQLKEVESIDEEDNYKMKRRRGMRGFHLLTLQQIHAGAIEDLPL